MAERNKFERKLPEDRRKALIEATLRSLGRHGHAGLSVRKISAEAGISIGLINHHYPSKEALIGQAYETLAVSMLENAKEAVAAAGPTGRERLTAFFNSVFGKRTFSPGTFRAWVVFWGLIGESPLLAEIQERTYANYRRFLESLLRQHAEETGIDIPDTRLATISLASLMDGLWLERSINPRTFSPEEAVALCDEWIDRLAHNKVTSGYAIHGRVSDHSLR
jgi:TetR/AcrR family transcriptional repressor of bet genes